MKHIILTASLLFSMTALVACTQAEGRPQQVSTSETAEPEFTGFDEVATQVADPESNDSTGLDIIEFNRLYSMHDEFHAVRCWYIMSHHDGSISMSCLPDSQIKNADR